MEKRFSVFFIFMLLFQTISSGIGPALVKAEGSNVDINTEVSLENEAGDEVIIEEVKDELAVKVVVDWSVENDYIEAGDKASTTLSIPEQVILDEDQSGNLEFDGNEVATYNADADGNVTVEFTDDVEEVEPDLLEGTFTLNGEVEVEAPEEDADETEDKSESDETKAKETDEKSEDEVKEEPEDTDKDEAKDEAEEKTFAEPAAIEASDAKDLGNIFTFESFQKDEKDIEDGVEIEFNTQYQLQYAWETENVYVKAGDTATLQLPDVFEHWTNAPDQDIVAGGTVVGTYSINNGVLTFVFNENIEGASVQNGYVGLNLEFNEEKFLEEWEHEIDFDGDGEKDLTVVVVPGEVETSLDKEGHPDSDLNAREITWEVDFTNGSEEDIENGVLTDSLPEGLGEARDFVVKELSFDFDGDKTVGDEVDFNEPTVDGNEFEMTFDNVPARGGYRVEYTTTITDYLIEDFTNEATFTYGDEELEADTTVYSGERSNPIQKEGTYNWTTGQIDWTIIVNENGMDIANAIVHDELPEEQTLAKGSLSVALNGKAVEVEETDFPITLGEVSADEVYVINFSTDIDWTKVNGGEYQHYNEFMNETKLTDGENPIGEDDAKVEHWRSSLIEKAGNANDYNYKDKVLSWTIDVNKAKHPINDAVLTDILPAGLGTITFEDITIKGAQVDSDDVTITRNDDGTQTIVINLGNIDDEVTVSYQTEVENFKENNFKNEASLGGDGIGVETPEDDATVNPPGNAFSKDFRGIDYNERTMDWRISVNPQREAITELIIEDTFPNNGMILLPETITVSIDGQKLEEGTDYTLNPNTDNEETGYHKGFTIKLTNIDQDNPLNDQLIVDFKTSYDPQLEVDGDLLDPHEGDPTHYVNHANFTGKTVNGNDFDENDDAETRVREDSWNSGKKEGQLVDFDENGTERKIAWQVYTNYQQQNLGKGVSVTDTLDFEGAIDENSIVVSVYKVDKDGHTTITDKTINDYSVEVDGKEFTLTFDEEFEVDERYAIEFTTTVPDISEESYPNNAMLKVGENEYPYTATVNYDRWDDFLDKQALGHTENDVFIGEELEWEVTVNESLSIIKGAKIKDTISAGLTYVVGSLEIATQSGTQLVEDTDYTLEVSETDEGQTILDISFKNNVTEALTLNYTTVVTAEDGQIVNNKIELDGVGIENKSKETSNLTAKQFSWVGGDFNPDRGAIKVLKVDSASKEVIDADEAKFELQYELNGERVQFGEEFTTENGVLEIGNLPLRTYYLKEVEAPDGYILLEEEIKIVVDKTFNNNDDNIIEVQFENVKKVDITVEKVWNDEEDQAGFRPDTITVNLHSSENEDPIDSTELNKENSWGASFTDLPEVDEDGEKIVYTIIEEEVTNYENVVTTEEDNPNHFIVTNTHKPELIDLDGTKTWDDADNQDGNRPDLITVRLLANGEEVANVEVTEEDEWKYSFTDLPNFANGEEINYTIQEDNVEDYSTEIEGMDITNSYTPEQTSINVIKAWEDASNQDGIRSDSITVKLLADGEETGEEVQLNEDNNWQADFTGLDVYLAGEEIVYTIEEVAVEGYETSITGTSEDGFVITNTHEPELIDLDGTKTWDDTDNQDGKRPDLITVNLLADGTKVDDIEVTGETDWTFEFTGLPKFENGEEINYTVQEDGVEDYSTEIDGMDITNSYTPDQTSINVVKNWEDTNNQDGIRSDSITVKLLADGEETGQEIKLDADNNWQADFTDLDVYVNGEEIEYTIEEVEVAGYVTEAIAGNAADGFVITNSYNPELINLEGTKTWDDADNQDGKRPNSITVRLLANGEEVADVAVTEEDEWKYSFADLPKFENGEEINYTVQEDNVEDYSTEIAGMDITNSYTPDQTSVNVIKHWDDANNQDGIRSESITVKLLADGEETGQELELNTDNNWQADFTDLDVYVDGAEIDYTIEEVAVEGYETTITGTPENGFVITNSYTPELINLDGTKTWDDADNQDGKRPDSITVNLLADGTKVADVEVTEETDWTFKFTDLPKFENGKKINYTVQEDAVEDYSTEIKGRDITNSYTPGQTSVNVVKNWKDENYKDLRPDSITVKLLADGEETDQEVQLDADNNWQADFTDLDEYVDGEKVVYTIEEVKVNGYVTEDIVGNAADGFVITNSPAKVSVGDYVWFDENKDGLQDDTDVPLKDVVLTIEDEDGNPVTDVYGNPVGPTTTDEKGWYTFDDLPIDHTYTVRIDQEASAEVLKEYVPTLEEVGDDRAIDSSTWEATSRHLTEDGEHDPTLDFGFVKKVIDVSGVKTWEDVDNQDGKRPDSIKVNLLANGEQVDSMEVTETDDWTYSFTDLLKYEVGEEIVYTVTENTVEGYTPEIDGYDITNHYTPGETAVTVTKDWQDDSNRDSIRPASIEVQLIAEGEAHGDPVELSDENNWTYTWKELNEKAAGETIVYSVVEITEVPEYETSINDEDHGNIIITNAYTPKVTKVNGVKTWDDADNEAGIRPDSITVNLLANGSIVDSVEVTEADDWNYSFTDLSKNKAGEEIVYTITEDVVEGYESTIDGYDITNTLIPEDPEEPGEPGKPGEPSEPGGDPAEEVSGTPDEGKEGSLPKTATNMFNMMMIGAALLIIGMAIFLAYRRRKEV